MATPDAFIEISDFSPGIYGDLHAASTTVASTATPDLRGNPGPRGNGMATVQNTYGCRADRTGALIPLPATRVGRNTPQVPGDVATHARGPDYMDPDRNATYLLDAQVGPITSTRSAAVDEDDFTDAADPLGDEMDYRGKPPVFTLWGFYFSPEADGADEDADYAYVIGREYRQWSEDQSIFDFLITRTRRRGTRGNVYNRLPTGSLALSRWNFVGTVDSPNPLNPEEPFLSMSHQAPAVVAMAGSAWPEHPFGNGLMAAETALTDVESDMLTPVYGDPEDDPRTIAPVRTTFTPPITPVITDGLLVPHLPGVVLGMNLRNTLIVGPQEAGQRDQWTWHGADDAPIEWPHNLLYSATMLIAHQGRIVMPGQHRAWQAQLTQYAQDPADDLRTYPNNDVLWYSEWGLPLNFWAPENPDDPDDEDWDPRFTKYIPLLVAEDQPAEIGVVGVTTTDELLIVKYRDGGALVSGDLDNPTVRRLPHVESTNGVSCKGAHTPIGFVYGSRNGIFAWQGGDTSKHLSPQIEGFFWDHTEGNPLEQYAGSRGRMAYWHGMVLVPNSYIYDTATEGWWRLPTEILSAGVPCSHYEPTYTGELYAFPYKHFGTDPGEQSVAWYTLDPETLARRYSWQSHPLMETRGRRFTFQDVRLVVTGDEGAASQITVTLTGWDETARETATREVVFSLRASSNPQILRRDIAPNFAAEYVQVRIETDSGDDDVPAPKIHSLRLGYKERATTPRAGHPGA